MVEITTSRCFVLWTKDRNGNVRFEPTVFTSAHAAIEAGERQIEKSLIVDYNYSVVFQPEISEQYTPKNKVLTSEGRAPSINL
jgi:hypothetical protein